MDSAGGTRTDAPGPTLYLESEQVDPTETFCTQVFDGGKSEEYRVIQLTATQSFESISDELDAQLEDINDPSEAAVIITTPQSGDKTAATQVGDETPLYGFRVSPKDLTGISIAFSQIIEKWEETEGTVKICLRDIESLLPYHDSDLLYRFLNTVLATLQGAGADVHTHLRRDVTDEQTFQLFASLFSEVVEPGESATKPAAESTADVEKDAIGAEPSETDEPDEEKPADVVPVSMSDEEIAEFLTEEGYGILAFGGESPYAIPMSYGYDDENRQLYLHMSSFDESEKQERIDGPTPVTLVVSQYDQPDRWRSVIVDGTLVELTAQAVEQRGVLRAFANSGLASVDVFNRDLSDVSFSWYALEPSSITGRQGVRSR